MVQIRRANYFDKSKLKKMISFLSSDAINHYSKVFQNASFSSLQSILPLGLKVLPESYVIEENKDIMGMVTVSPTVGNAHRIVISRLLLDDNYFTVGKQLIDFIVAHYGAKGATSFLSMIDDSYVELLHLFIEGCGFRQCSSEQLWKLEEIRFSNPGSTFFRPFKNSDSQAVAMIFNDSIMTHFKYSISKTKDEYQESFFTGLKDSYVLKFVVEDEKLKTLKAYFSITTSDNLNYILNISKSVWYDCEWEDILNFAVNQVSKRTKEFNLFVRVRKYTTTAESLENYLTGKSAKCIQNQVVLVKDFYKVIKDGERSNAAKLVLFNELGEKPAFKV